MIIINKLEIENGKYQIENNNGIVKVYRYGELWLDGVTKFELCLIQRIEELETQLSINTSHMKQLQKQNQYYKQALEEIRSLYPLRNAGYQLSEIRKIVIEALEGEE